MSRQCLTRSSPTGIAPAATIQRTMDATAVRPGQDFESLLSSVKRIAQEVSAAHAVDVDAKARFPIESIDALREAGVLSACVPRELGGANCSMSELAQFCST